MLEGGGPERTEYLSRLAKLSPRTGGVRVGAPQVWPFLPPRGLFRSDGAHGSNFRVDDHLSRSGAIREEPKADESRRPAVLISRFPGSRQGARGGITIVLCKWLISRSRLESGLGWW